MTGSGYELDKLVPLLGGALKSTQPLPADPAGADRLARSLKKMTKPLGLIRLGGHFPKGGYGVQHGRGAEATEAEA